MDPALRLMGEDMIGIFWLNTRLGLDHPFLNGGCWI